jgi:hypothetical protein
MTRFPVITAVANVLAHAPDLVRYGSKPLRDLARDPALGAQLAARLRGHAEAVAYAPNQAYLGNRDAETLWTLPRPWFATPDPVASRDGAFGDFIGETELLGLLKWSLFLGRMTEAADGISFLVEA